MMRRKSIYCLLPLLVGCEEPPPEPENLTRTAAPKASAANGSLDLGGKAAAATATANPSPPPVRELAAKPVAEVKASADDPLAGKFTLADATKGLTGKGPLVADIKTDKGTLNCTLYEDKAPITVANFVGLARGLRPWKTPAGKWEKKPGYDGTTFHRVVKGFMIQGGDPAGSGAGEPGYVIPDEVWAGARHDTRGLLCMANRGPNTNGMQFFVMDGVAAHLDGGYTIFGKCEPESVVEALASVPVRGERAVTPPKIEKVSVKRLKDAPKPADAPAAPGGTKPPAPKPAAPSAPKAPTPPAP
ncbi:MAG: peptidylprolyl isomerase [Myxococcales bacterium]|nr:peptidylprolyl isomerase [Myxococcales bacterium]